MQYKILILATNSNEKDYFTFALDDSQNEFVTSDLVALETKLLELMKDYASDKLRVVNDVSYTIDLIFS